MSQSSAIVIPARMASTRFPNKPMARIAGKTMIERMWRIAQAAAGEGDAFIATDDEGLKKFAENFGARVLMTSPDCLTGTDRVAETSHFLPHDIFFSLQADAVLTPPWVIAEVLRTMLFDPALQMATPAVRLTGKALSDFALSKKEGSSSGTTVVFDKRGDALYFSKALLPFHRDPLSPDRQVYRHIGLYAYRKQTLQQLSLLPEGPLEKAEKLEQLRALENGIPIRVVPVDYRGRTHGSVDRPEDVALIESIIAKEGELV